MYARSTTRADDFDQLLRCRYGLPRAKRRPSEGPAGTGVSTTVALTADTGGEVLTVKAPAAEPAFEEYIVDRPEPPAVATPPAPTPSSAAPVPAGSQPGPGVVDSGRSAEPLPAPNESALRSPVSSPAPANAPAPVSPPAPGSSSAPPATNGAQAGVGSPSPTASSPVTQDELVQDMQAILSGRKVYDPGTGSVRDRAAGPPPPPAAPERPAPTAKDEQAIFDRIAQSLEHANSFDLGTVELRRRFEGFDRADERRRAGSAPPGPQPGPRPPVEVGQAAFVQDLDAIARVRSTPVFTTDELRAAYHKDGPWSGLADRESACGGSSLAFAVAPERSAALYDTGEHVMAAGDLYPDQLVVGSGGGVRFSYGQIIAMGDFYASVDQMLAAPSIELNGLKALIQRSTDFYRGNRRDPAKDVKDATWDTATNGRYLQLAEANYDHFAPAGLTGMTGPGREYDNRRRWEELHQRAITEMQQLILANTDTSPFPAGPLATNAFADHFLTDAFASGHLINKEVVLDKFRARFFSGGSINAAGRAFFEQVAKKAYKDDVARRFSELEPSSPPLCANGWCLPIHPNIRTHGMFAEVLIQAAEAEPVKIGNLAVKLIHDKLNDDGVEVVNDAGDPAWQLTGDKSMNPTSLAIMRRAVQQSVDNINDPAILGSNLNLQPFLERVWRHTPRPTSAGIAVIQRLVDKFTDPTSAEMVTATAVLIDRQLDTLITALLDSERMRKD